MGAQLYQEVVKIQGNFFCDNVTNILLSRTDTLCFTIATITVIADTLINSMHP